jgi:hypothetical protein
MTTTISESVRNSVIQSDREFVYPVYHLDFDAAETDSYFSLQKIEVAENPCKTTLMN